MTHLQHTQKVNPYGLNREQFIAYLESNISPTLVFDFAADIYGLLSGLFRQNCIDSVMREWAFQWTSEKLGLDYDVIYNKWLDR